jgi:hypothetical protein
LDLDEDRGLKLMKLKFIAMIENKNILMKKFLKLAVQEFGAFNRFIQSNSHNCSPLLLKCLVICTSPTI